MQCYDIFCDTGYKNMYVCMYGQLQFLKSQNQEIPTNAYTFYDPSVYVCVCVCTCAHACIHTHTALFLYKNSVCQTAWKIINFTRLPISNISYMIHIPRGKWRKSTHTHTHTGCTRIISLHLEEDSITIWKHNNTEIRPVTLLFVFPL